MKATATPHSATLAWSQPAQPSGTTVAGVTVQRNSATIATLTPGVLSYVDTAVTAGATYSYSVTNVFADSTSAASFPVTATIPPDVTPPPACSAPAVGCRITILSGPANVRAVALNAGFGLPIYGTEPTAAAGAIVALSTAAVTGPPAFHWIQITFDTCPWPKPANDLACTGWVGDNNIVLASGPPAISVSIAPASATLSTSATQQFTATVANDSATAGVTWSATTGTISTSGLFTAPAAAGTSTVKATSVTDPTKSASATVTITLPALTLNCTTASSGVGNLSPGAYSMTVTQGSRTQSCTGTK